MASKEETEIASIGLVGGYLSYSVCTVGLYVSKLTKFECILCIYYAGFSYLGATQYSVYNKLYPLLFDGIKHRMARNMAMTTADMTIHGPLVYFPVFYLFKGFVYEKSISMDVARQSMYQYFVINFREDMKAMYTVWCPAMFFMFTFLPIQYRVPFLLSIGLFWATMLSLKRGEPDAVSN